MPLFGAHLSVSGGLHKAVSAAVTLGCETVQIFTKNPNIWDGQPLEPVEIQRFRQAVDDAGLKYPTAHDSYLINLASPDETLFRKSIAAFTHEVHRAEALGLSYLVMHPGAHTGSGEEAGLARVIAALDEVRAACPCGNVGVLLETTAGQGTCLGHRFEHLRTILHGVKDASWLGVCVDTCHIFAAGYPLRTKKEYSATFNELESVIGRKHLKLFHVNDSKREQGSRVDRHAAIGQGEIGINAFRQLVNDPRFAAVPMILETPKEDEAGKEMDPVNLEVLRKLLVRS